jgi:hypothetical protein
VGFLGAGVDSHVRHHDRLVGWGRYVCFIVFGPKSLKKIGKLLSYLFVLITIFYGFFCEAFLWSSFGVVALLALGKPYRFFYV